MNPQESVRLMQQLAHAYAKNGHACRLRGIVVAPQVWDALVMEGKILGHEAEDFRGVSVTCREGTRKLEYRFWVLPTPTLPRRYVDGFFFVHHSREVYEEKYLGREEEILVSGECRRLDLKFLVITEINAIDGVIQLDDRWTLKREGLSLATHHQVCLDEVQEIVDELLAEQPEVAGLLEEVKKEVPFGGDYEQLFHGIEAVQHFTYLVRETLRQRFARGSLVHNPPEAEWFGNERLWLWHYQIAFEKDSTFRMSVGRLLMKSTPSSDGPPNLAVVGIDLDGWDRTHEVTVFGPTQDWRGFAEYAVSHFQYEEVALFLWEQGFPVEDVEQLRQAFPVEDWWGDWVDDEDLGRIRYGGYDPEKGHLFRAHFVDTRAKVWWLTVATAQDETERERLQEEFFPSDWQGWPETRREKAFDVHVLAYESEME